MKSHTITTTTVIYYRQTSRQAGNRNIFLSPCLPLGDEQDSDLGGGRSRGRVTNEQTTATCEMQKITHKKSHWGVLSRTGDTCAEFQSINQFPSFHSLLRPAGSSNTLRSLFPSGHVTPTTHSEIFSHGKWQIVYRSVNDNDLSWNRLLCIIFIRPRSHLETLSFPANSFQAVGGFEFVTAEAEKISNLSRGGGRCQLISFIQLLSVFDIVL